MTNDQRQGDAPDPFTILDVPDAGQYELHDGDTTIGFAKYSDRGDGRVFMHTVVDSAYEGQASARVSHASCSRMLRRVANGSCRCAPS